VAFLLPCGSQTGKRARGSTRSPDRRVALSDPKIHLIFFIFQSALTSFVRSTRF
jgi:hypothetical protein